jgi:nicotinamidase-related amidase
MEHTDDGTLLLVIDMQRDFIDGPLGTPEAEAIVPAVAEAIEAHRQVIFTLDTHGEDYLSTQEGRLLPVPHCLAGTDGHRLHPSLEPLSAGYPQFCKETFGSTALGEAVRERFQAGITQRVVLVGVCTDICVISNALLLRAFCPELPIAVDSRCCAGVTPERHQTALAAMAACQITIL